MYTCLILQHISQNYRFYSLLMCFWHWKLPGFIEDVNRVFFIEEVAFFSNYFYIFFESIRGVYKQKRDNRLAPFICLFIGLFRLCFCVFMIFTFDLLHLEYFQREIAREIFKYYKRWKTSTGWSSEILETPKTLKNKNAEKIWKHLCNSTFFQLQFSFFLFQQTETTWTPMEL